MSPLGLAVFPPGSYIPQAASLPGVPLSDPAEDAEGPEGIPATWLAAGLAGGDGDGFVVGAIEEPAAVGLAFALEDLNCWPEERVGWRVSRGSQVVETAKDVVVVAGREG